MSNILKVLALALLALSCGCATTRSPHVEERYDGSDRLIERTIRAPGGALLRREQYRYPSTDITVVTTHIPGEDGTWQEIEAYHLHDTSLTYLLTRHYNATGGLLETTSALDTPPDFSRSDVHLVPPR